MIQERYLPAVIDQIIPLLPKEWVILKDKLEALARSASYTAPEDMYRHWLDLCNLLSNHLGNPNTEWKEKVSTIVRGQE